MMQLSQVRSFAFALLAIMLLIILPCNAPKAAAKDKVLKIGTVAPLNLKEGVEIQRWMNLFAKIVNEKGGWKIGNDVYKLQSIVYDGRKEWRPGLTMSN